MFPVLTSSTPVTLCLSSSTSSSLFCKMFDAAWTVATAEVVFFYSIHYNHFTKAQSTWVMWGKPWVIYSMLTAQGLSALMFHRQIRHKFKFSFTARSCSPCHATIVANCTSCVGKSLVIVLNSVLTKWGFLWDCLSSDFWVYLSSRFRFGEKIGA